MKVWLISSEVTFLPDNGHAGLRRLLQAAPSGTIDRLVLVRAPPAQTLGFIAKASVAGFFGISTSLARNLARNLGSGGDDARLTLCAEADVDVERCDDVNQLELAAAVRAARVDLIVNVRTRSIYGQDLLRSPRLGCLNVHHGLLPTYRGLFCDLYALTEGRPAGFSIHEMTARVDAGALLHVEATSPAGERRYASHLQRTSLREADVLGALLHEVERTGALPAARPNRCAAPVVTHNPRLRDVLRVQRARVRA